MGNYSEIDIFEFWDGDVSGSPCENYNNHIMSIHTGPAPNDNRYNRNDKYPLQNIDQFHTYKLEWNKYEVSIFVDGIKIGYATKYYDGNYLDYPHVMPHCNYGTTENRWDPDRSYTCNYLQQLPDNLYSLFWPNKPNWWPKWAPWPNIPNVLYYPNKIIESTYFPSKNRVMNIIINNNINREYTSENLLEFSQDNQTLFIDWIKVYQPFCCGEDKTVYTRTDFYNLTNYTCFLTGKIITVGNNAADSPVLQLLPENDGPYYRQIPYYLLATDEIRILGEAVFEGKTYTEMRITDCNGSSGARLANENSEPTSNENNIVSTNFDIKEITSVENNKNENVEFFEVYPIPTTDFIQIKCDNETFEKITDLWLIDLNGKNYVINKSLTINMENFDSGCYQLKIILNNGKIINKKIIKI
jgi:hypothetical protein